MMRKPWAKPRLHEPANHGIAPPPAGRRGDAVIRGISWSVVTPVTVQRWWKDPNAGCPVFICMLAQVQENVRMRCEVVRAGRAHRLLLRQFFELYAHEFSVWNQADVDAAGRFTPDDFLLDGWRRRDGSGRYLLKVNGCWAGFAFVERGSYRTPGVARNWLMDEFFLLLRYRGQGLGRWFALAVMGRHPGTWEIGQIPQNSAATAFWRRVLSGAGSGGVEEFFVDNDAWNGPVQVVHVGDE